jgi:tetratricopeptide (TPR) repeat protein
MPQDSTGELPRRRWWLKPLCIAALICALGAGAFWAYRAGEPARLSKQARAHLDAGDFRSAAMALRRAVMIAPQHPEAVRLMAELADRLGSPTAPEWREQLAALNPDSQSDRAAWAASAIRSRRLDAAEEALAGAPPAFRSTAEYEALRGMAAMGKGNWREAEHAFGEATRRDPARVSYRYNLAVAQAQNPDPKVQEEGINKLRQLNSDGDFANPARRALIRIHMRAKRPDDALGLNKQVLASADAMFNDHLVELELLRKLRSEEFNAEVERARELAAKTPVDLAALFTWSTLNDYAGGIRPWAESLDPKVRQNPQVIESYAELLAATNDWPALTALAAQKLPWARGDAMRHAFAALAADKSGRQEMAGSFWQLAVQSGAQSSDTAMAVAYFAHRAGWRPRLLEMLWAVSNRPDAEWALRMLHPLCVEDRNTSGLLRVAKRLLVLHPDDDRARNNVAALGLLLGERSASHLDTARRLHEKTPGDPVFASTYAYALHVSGQSPAGLAVIEKLSAELRQRPDIALYHAVLLSAAGKTQQASEAAALARRASMLPEEEKLLAAALGEV